MAALECKRIRPIAPGRAVRPDFGFKMLAGQEQAHNEQWVCRACKASLSPSGPAPIWPQRGSAGSTDPLLILGMFLSSQHLETKIARSYGPFLDAFQCSHSPPARIAEKFKNALSQAISLRRAEGLQKSISENLALRESLLVRFRFVFCVEESL